jgi:hypothetical protein
MHPSNLALIAPPGAWPAESTSTEQSSRTTISQSELRQYRMLQECERERKQMREILLQRLDNGSAVEPGKLTVDVQQSQTRRLTKGNLTRLLGEETVAGLTELVELTTQRSLVVGNTEHSNSRPC